MLFERTKRMKRIISFLSAALLVLVMPLSVAADQPGYMETEEWDVLSFTNQERAKNNRLPLTVFDELQSAAEVRAVEIVEKFAHERPDGSECFTALDEISYTIAGENIAAGYLDAQSVVDAWMNSPSHRENMLNPNYKHLAAGYYVQNGSDYIRHWTQFFLGGCTTTALNNVGNKPVFDRDGKLVSTGSMISVTCDLHGTSYIALKDIDYFCLPNQYGDSTYVVAHDGVVKELPCKVAFNDVKDTAWYAAAVEYAVDEGLMEGMDGATFAPEKGMTRAQLVTVIHRMKGSPAAVNEAGFTDVGNRYYTDAVNWAAENEIVEGVGDGKFAPDSPITRAQLATILLRVDQMEQSDTPNTANLTQFADGNSVPRWAKTALEWSVAEGLIKGIVKDGKTYINDSGNATRAQVAAVLMRYIES